jgi:PAS domain S-box-containing protein
MTPHNDYASEAERKAGRPRRGVPLRTQLILLLCALVLVATASLGSIAYASSRAIIEGGAVSEVGTTANARKQVLLTVLTEQKARAEALLKSASLGCAPEEIWCLRKVLKDFVATGGATAARLVYQGRRPVVVGKGGAALASAPVPMPDQVARFDFDDQRQPYYVMVARAVTEDGESIVTLRGDMQAVNRIYADRFGLGQSGETFLADAAGRFLTPPRYDRKVADPVSGEQAMKPCSAGPDREVLDQDYRGVAVIHAFRRIAEIDDACVIAQIDQAEAFAQTNALRKKVEIVSAVLAVLAIACSLLFAQLVSRPINQLSNRARLLQAGDYDSAVPARGPSEVQTFARTFEAMARSLKDSHMALIRSTEQIGNILESINEGFFAFDREGTCTYVNEKGIALAGVSRDELLGKKLQELVPSAVSGRERAELHRAASENTPVQFEHYHEPLDAWFEVSACPSRDGIAVFLRDVSERRRFQERFQQTQKLESLGLLAGGIAHDFNNLLTGIIGNTSILLEDIPSESPMRVSLQDVATAAGRASALTQQLLAYAGKGRFVVEPLDLSTLVRETSNLIKTSIPMTVELRLQLAPDLPAIEGDASQIQQLVMNLVLNAAEAIREGSTGMVVVTTGTQMVNEAYIQQMFSGDEIAVGYYVMLDVTDTGCGMSEATVARIFDPFFTTKFAGRGLGLAAATGIVRGHKGVLKVHSVPGKGSSFRVLFPASEGKPNRGRSDFHEMDLKGTGTILVIDDEEIVRRTAKSVLEHYGYTVIVADNGRKGVELLTKADAVALVILDMTMPAMSGEETLRQLRAVRRDLPVILSSGYNELEATRTLTAKGSAGFIQKPYSPSRLAEQIKIVLASRRVA